MRSTCICAVLGLAGALALPVAALADPIHRIDNDAYWHHDSGWVFPARFGGFEREGAAQDVAGTADAVAHYVRVANGVRVVVSVEVFSADSAAPNSLLAMARGELVGSVVGVQGHLTDDTLPVGKGLTASCLRFAASGDAPSEAMYFVEAGAWRVRIRATLPAAARGVLDELDAFVQSQRWDTLGTR